VADTSAVPNADANIGTDAVNTGTERAGVKCGCTVCGCADVPTCKMQTNIADIICGCDG